MACCSATGHRSSCTHAPDVATCLGALAAAAGPAPAHGLVGSAGKAAFNDVVRDVAHVCASGAVPPTAANVHNAAAWVQLLRCPVALQHAM
eukprot:238479-Chlamydomonas_euryale.AAC.1